jgi:hypothetical protein
MDEQCSG